MKEGTAEPPASADVTAKRASLSSGMGTLLRGGNGGPKAANEGESHAQISGTRGSWKRVVQMSLVLADLLLFGLAARILLRASRPLGPGDLTLCIIAVSLGAGLTCLALWLRSSD